MNAIAFLWRDMSIYWSGIFTALAGLCFCLTACSLQLAKGRSLRPMALFFPAAILFSLVLGRLGHWYCHPLQYSDFAAAMTDYTTGGFILTGAFAGVLLAAVLVRLTRLTEDLGAFLDVLTPAGALAIAVGRLGSFFDLSGRGSFLPSAAWLQQLPFSAPAATAAGTVEWRFATFLWQSGAAAALFLVTLWLLFALKRPDNGHVFGLFMPLYGAVQIILDSTRYDSGFLRANGFISLTQLCCLALLVAAGVVYSLRSVKIHGFRPWHGWLWAAFLLLGGVGGYMEYFVQRHGNRFALAYPVMTACFLLAAGIVCLLFRTTRTCPENNKEPAQ